ncbi:hypothetical protein, partial [Salmonella enterica]|uniref:hypothetical protein n=1 Tax=Salmonella enterica TaxID=28901 RepID=UPI001E3F06E9
NSYTGGTTISGGTLVASNVEALGTGDITDNATLELNGFPAAILIPAVPLSATARWSPATLRRWAAATSPTTPRWK